MYDMIYRERIYIYIHNTCKYICMYIYAYIQMVSGDRTSRAIAPTSSPTWFGIWGFRIRLQTFKFRVSGSEFKEMGFRVWCFEALKVEISCVGSRISDFGRRVWALGSWISAFGLRDSDSGLRVSVCGLSVSGLRVSGFGYNSFPSGIRVSG